MTRSFHSLQMLELCMEEHMAAMKRGCLMQVGNADATKLWERPEKLEVLSRLSSPWSRIEAASPADRVFLCRSGFKIPLLY